LLFAALGETRRVPDHSGAALVLRVLDRPGGGRGLVDVAGLDVPVATGLGREQPDHAAVGQVGQAVDERVDQVAVVLAPPQQDDVDDVVGVVGGDELGAGACLDVGDEVLVDVVADADHLHDRAGLDPELLGQATRCRVVRGRAHRYPFRSAPTGRVARSPPDRCSGRKWPQGQDRPAEAPAAPSGPARGARSDRSRPAGSGVAAALPMQRPTTTAGGRVAAGRWAATGRAAGPDAARAGESAARAALAGRDDAVLLVVFASDGLDLTGLLAGVRAAGGEVPVVGCSTAGEITGAGPSDQSVAVFALGGPG
jgi:hypothetical protein